MRITPLDVRKQEFRRAVRGFDCDEVRAFLTTLADEYETVLVDNRQLRERVLEQDEKLGEYKGMEQTLRNTLMTAERAMQETRENANREGGLIVQESQMKARGIMEECRVRTEELRREIQGLRKEKETYLARFKGLAEAQIQFVESHKDDFRDLDQRLVDIVDSVVAGVDERVRASVDIPRTVPQATAAPAPAPEIEIPSVQAPAAAQESPTVDVWRDYDPITGNDRAAETNSPAIENIPAADPVEPVVDNSVQAPATDTESVSDEIAAVIEESLDSKALERL